MSTHERKTWLVCYDITDPGRLRRVHRRLVKEGASVQYSAFVVVGTDGDLRDLMDLLDTLIDPSQDDVRAYHLPQRCRVWTMGTQFLPAGIAVDPATASRVLLGSAAGSGELNFAVT